MLLEDFQMLSPTNEVPLTMFNSQTLLYFFSQFSSISRKVLSVISSHQTPGWVPSLRLLRPNVTHFARTLQGVAPSGQQPICGQSGFSLQGLAALAAGSVQRNNMEAANSVHQFCASSRQRL